MLAEKLTNLSAEHEGKIPGQAVLKLLQKSTLGPALPGFAQKGFGAVTKPNALLAWKKTGLDRLFDPSVQLEAAKRHAEGRLFASSNDHTSQHAKPDAFEEPEKTILTVQADAELQQALISDVFSRMNTVLGRPPSLGIATALGISGAPAVGAAAAASSTASKTPETAIRPPAPPAFGRPRCYGWCYGGWRRRLRFVCHDGY